MLTLCSGTLSKSARAFCSFGQLCVTPRDWFTQLTGCAQSRLVFLVPSVGDVGSDTVPLDLPGPSMEGCRGTKASESDKCLCKSYMAAFGAPPVERCWTVVTLPRLSD